MCLDVIVVPGLSLIDQSLFRYMAPEIYRREHYDGRQIDIWSTGATLLVCLHGDYPWAAPTRIPLGAEGIYR